MLKIMIAKIKKFLPALILGTETTVLSLLYCSTSPLTYLPVSDTSAAVLMGRIVMNGQIPFIDSHDAKGPIWWYICALGQLFSTDTYYGFYPITLGILLVSVYLLYRITKIFWSTPLALTVSALGSLAWLIPRADIGIFCPEILMIPMGLYLVLLGIKIVSKLNQQIYWYHLGAGLLAAVMFWSKYNYTVAFAGFYFSVIIIWIIQRDWINFSKITGTVLGFLIISVPVIFFYTIQNGLGALYQGYFVDNLIYRFHPPAGIRAKIFHIFENIHYNISIHYFEIVVIVLASIICIIGMHRRLKSPGIYIAISTVTFTTLAGFAVSGWRYQFTPYLPLVALAIAYLSKQIIFELRSRHAICLTSALIFTIIFMQTIPSNYSVDSAGNRRNYQTIADSINSYSASPSILTLSDFISGSLESQILTIAQSRAIPTGKYWISSLYKSQQSQRINDVIHQAGDLLLLRTMDTGQNYSFFDASTNQPFEVQIPDYVLNYYIIRTADVVNAYPLVLLEKRAQPLDPNFELNV
jgi:hypothetical protein